MGEKNMYRNAFFALSIELTSIANVLLFIFYFPARSQNHITLNRIMDWRKNVLHKRNGI